MALIFPQCSFTLSPLTQSNKGNLQLVHGHQMRVSQLKQGGKHTKSVTTCAVRQGVPGSTVVPAEFPAVKRSDFPVDFVFGGSTSAVQSEGAANVDGRTPSTWDYILTQQGYTDGPLSYVNYKEDVKLLKQMGVDVYRFSISWSRLLPKGRGEINPKAKEFYNNLINELRANGIEPFVTIFHLDLPVALVNEYNGFLDVKIVEDFKHFSDTCFLHFGDRVKYWGTINEPDVYAQHGYKPGMVGPDDPARYPYIVAKNIILAHATAVKHYKKFYQGPQRGVIGMTVSLIWMEAYEKGSKVDKEAADRAFAFHTDLFVEPFVYGDYPFIIKALVRDRLPAFTAAEKELIKGAYDFVGINYYTARYTKSLPISANDVPTDMDKDQYLDLLEIGADGKHIGDEIAKEIYSAPDGLREGLLKLKEHYGNTPIYITENGCADISTPNHEVPDDGYRITFMNTHLKAVKDAISLGANVKSYIHWSMIDVVELGGGYDVRLGLNHINYDNFERTPKKSAKWYKEFLKKSPR